MTNCVKLGGERERRRDRIQRGSGERNIIYIFLCMIEKEKNLKLREINYNNFPWTKIYQRQTLSHK
jgi:hypothetical protein